MPPVRYGIVGSGQVAIKGHIPELLRIPQPEVVAVCDPDSQARTRVPELVPAAWRYSDFGDLLSDADLEAALIATPNWLHKDQAIAAFQQENMFSWKTLSVWTSTNASGFSTCGGAAAACCKWGMNFATRP